MFVLSNLTLKYHDSFIEAGLTPTFLPPKEDIPGIYTQFVPLNFSDFEKDEYDDFSVFSIQEIDDNDNVTFTFTEKFSYYAYAKECLN